jgi:hypothetical protein
MWCIGELTAEYRRCRYELLELYARPYDPREPVICLDEKCKQLLRETRRPLPAKVATLAKEDYEYERAGTCNIFLAVEPRGQRRIAQVTARRTKVDFVAFVCRMLRRAYSRVRTVHLVLDNLNVHWRENYTPNHASWLNMAEIEIGILQRHCLARSAAEQATLTTAVAAWQEADRKLSRHYVSQLTCSCTSPRLSAAERLCCITT